MTSLADTVSTLLLRLWPERRHQERLLDLGERKAWNEVHRSEAVSRFATWLTTELLLPPWLNARAAPDVSAQAALPVVPTAGVKAVPGVGLHTVALACLVGAEPKTLANTLGQPRRSDRRDHRWLSFLSRLDREEVDADALVFHRRSPALVADELGHGAKRCAPDAGDALLLLSLVALWQRRRPTAEARGARGAVVSRRAVPKPAVAMKWDVVALSQVKPLIDLALLRGGPFGRNLAATVLDAALSEAHLAPHRAHGRAEA